MFGLLLFAVWSCDKDDVADNRMKGFVGDWNWIQTDGGIAYHIHDTPESIEKSYRIILTDAYEISIIENELERVISSYALSLKESIYSGEPELFLEVSDDVQIPSLVVNGIITLVSADTLTIADNNYDGVGSTFVRRK